MDQVKALVLRQTALQTDTHHPVKELKEIRNGYSRHCYGWFKRLDASEHWKVDTVEERLCRKPQAAEQHHTRTHNTVQAGPGKKADADWQVPSCSSNTISGFCVCLSHTAAMMSPVCINVCVRHNGHTPQQLE